MTISRNDFSCLSSNLIKSVFFLSGICYCVNSNFWLVNFVSRRNVSDAWHLQLASSKVLLSNCSEKKILWRRSFLDSTFDASLFYRSLTSLLLELNCEIVNIFKTVLFSNNNECLLVIIREMQMFSSILG